MAVDENMTVEKLREALEALGVSTDGD